MNTYYTHISMAIKLNATAILWLKAVLEEIYTNFLPGDYCAEDVVSRAAVARLGLTLEEAGCLENLAKQDRFLLEKEQEPGVVYFTSHDVDIEAIAVLAQMLIKRFQLKPIGFCYAYTAEKFELDTFGGGAYWVTADEIDIIDAQNWLTERIESVETSAT